MLNRIFNAMECEKCGARMKSVPLQMYGERFRAKECVSCGHRTVPLDVAIRISEKNVPKMEMKKKIIRVGDSSAITIPKEIRHFFSPGDDVLFCFEPKNMEIKIRK